LLPQYWGKGFAVELGEALIQYAFDHLGSKRVYATIDPENIASLHTVKKLGMIFERDGTYERLGKIKEVKYFVKYQNRVIKE